jgi:nicotinamidase-related amidase
LSSAKGEDGMVLTQGKRWVHLCIDVQRMFAEETPWHAPWLRRVLPAIEELAGQTAGRTIFTRFLPPRTRLL